MRASETLASPESGAEESGILMGFIRTWDRFWFTPMDPTTLAFVRICCGLLAFYVHLTYSWGLLGYVGPDGWLNEATATFIQRDVQPYAPSLDWSEVGTPMAKGSYFWSVYYHVTNAGWIVALHVFFLIVMALYAVGLWTRLTGAITWMAAMSYVQRSSNTVFGLDTMMMIVLFYLQIGPAGAALSVDRWLAKRKARLRGEPVPPIEPTISANFAIRLIQVHLCLIYFAGGTTKLLGSTWWGATSLNIVMLNPEFTPLDSPWYYNTLRWLANHRTLWEIFMTGGILYTLIVEISFGYLVWDKRYRWVLVCSAVMLHLGIGLFMGLVTFSLMMMIMLSSFLPPDGIRQVVEDILRIFSKQPAEAKTIAPRQTAELVLSR